MTTPARRGEVTADGMTRVAAVVAAMVASSPDVADSRGELGDLIAKAAQEVEQHASATRAMRMRGLAQRGRANASLAAASGGSEAPAVRTLDVIR